MIKMSKKKKTISYKLTTTVGEVVLDVEVLVLVGVVVDPPPVPPAAQMAY